MKVEDTLSSQNSHPHLNSSCPLLLQASPVKKKNKLKNLQRTSAGFPHHAGCFVHLPALGVYCSHQFPCTFSKMVLTPQ